MTIDTGATLRELRERKPLVHQITNYVVMNETANATLALGALPVMAHAPQEVEEMVGLAAALVLNIGTLSDALDRGDAARREGGERARDPGRARPRRRGRDARTGRTPRGGSSTRSTSLSCAGTRARSRRSSASRRRCAASSRLATAATRPSSPGRRRRVSVSSPRSPGPSTTSRTASAVLSVANGHPLLASITGTGCMSTAMTGCFLAGKPTLRSRPRSEALVAFGVAGEDAAAGAERAGQLPRRALRRAGGSRPGDVDRAGEGRVRVRLHALVADLESARRAGGGGRDGRPVAPEGRSDRRARRARKRPWTGSAPS